MKYSYVVLDKCKESYLSKMNVSYTYAGLPSPIFPIQLKTTTPCACRAGRQPLPSIFGLSNFKLPNSENAIARLV